MRRKTLEERQSLRKFINGMLLVPLLGILWLVFVFQVSRLRGPDNFLAISFLLIGIVQIIYLLPVGLYFWRKGHSEYLKGLIMGDAIVALLNGSCWAGAYISDWNSYGFLPLAATLLMSLLVFLFTLIVFLFNLK